MQYIPWSDRPVSWQYRNVLERVLNTGEFAETSQGPRALTTMQETMRFPLEDGFPIFTERSLLGFWRKPIDELAAFINGARTEAALQKFGCDWWGHWTTESKTAALGLEPGDMGPGSYGAAFHDFPRPDGTGFDQFANLIEQLRERPQDRTHFITPWIPYYQTRGTGKLRKAVLAPCHGWVHVRVLNGRIHLHMFQRSGDLPIGVPSNAIQYAALTLMLSHLTDFEPGTYYHTISDAHIYEDQIAHVKAMLDRSPGRLPSVTLNAEGRSVTDIHDFRGHHFDLADYHPHPGIRGIPVAV